MDTTRLHTEKGWLEERFRAAEPFISNSNDLAIRKLIRFLQKTATGCGGHFLFEVQSNITQLLLNVPALTISLSEVVVKL